MKTYQAKKIRNIAIVGHAGSGKTSLVEAILFQTGVTDRLGKVLDGNTVSDFDAEEIRRKCSVSSSLSFTEHNESKINIIDAPGLFDFEGGFYEAVRASDSALICVSAKSGLSVGAIKAFKAARNINRCAAFFINKLDAENGDFYKTLEELKTEFGPRVCPIVVPHMNGNVVDCYINLIEMKAYKFDNGKASEVPMPDTGHRLDGLVAAISEAVAEADEELFEKYFSGEEFTLEEMQVGIKKGAKIGAIFPVFCGSALTLDGVNMLLDGITKLLPSAQLMDGETGYDGGDNIIEIPCEEGAPAAAIIFKTVSDPFVGKMSYFRVITGEIKSDMQVYNVRTGENEKMGKLLFMRGKKQFDTPCVTSGDIGVATKLTNFKTGDTISTSAKPIRLEPANFPLPCLSMAIVLASKNDEAKISGALSKILEEDKTLSVYNNLETHQQIITGLGEQHLDTVVSKIKQKFGIDISLETPIVAYREAIQKKVKVEGKHKKQTGGHGQFGHVWIEFEPHDGEDLIFEEKIFGGAVPKGFFPAVEKGLRESMLHGVLAGYPVVGLKATLVDGSYHPVDSSEMSFKVAAQLAYKAGLAAANPILLEPIGTLKAFLPDSYTGDIMGEINKRRGRVLGMNPTDDGLTLIEAEVPTSEMHDFTTYLRALTGGRGRFTFEFVRYEQLPQHLVADVIAAAPKQHEE